VTVATRTSAGDVQYLTGDQQGTATLAVDSSNLAVSERFYDPYGNPVGTATGTWPGDKGFQDGSADTSTGLDDLGASGPRCQRRRRRYPVGYSFLTMRSCVIWFREPNGSQRRQQPSDAGLSPAMIIAAKRHIEPRWAIPADGPDAPCKRTVGGSNPLTGSRPVDYKQKRRLTCDYASKAAFRFFRLATAASG
jgi:hypothetical protein